MQKTYSEALVPQVLIKFDHKVLAEVVSFILGIALLSLLAQVAIPLPWTPVPITGQTMGVTLVALSWGRKRAFSVLLGYLALGAVGLPIFALGKNGLLMGPTLGYLIGMAVSSFIVGGLADKGFTTSFKKSLLAAYLGSAIVFSFGLLGLSFFVPKEVLLVSGLFPFLLGDVVKNLIAASVSWKIRSAQK